MIFGPAHVFEKPKRNAGKGADADTDADVDADAGTDLQCGSVVV